MRLLVFTTLLTALVCLAQQSAPSAAGSPAITVPAGTKSSAAADQSSRNQDRAPGRRCACRSRFPRDDFEYGGHPSRHLPGRSYRPGDPPRLSRRVHHALHPYGLQQRLHRAFAGRHGGHAGRADAHQRSIRRSLRRHGFPILNSDAFSTILARTQQGFDDWIRGRGRRGRNRPGGDPRPPRPTQPRGDGMEFVPARRAKLLAAGRLAIGLSFTL